MITSWRKSAALVALCLLPVLAQGASFEYAVEIVAPEPLVRLLSAWLDLTRWRGRSGMDSAQLRRLMQRTPQQARELLATEGYFDAEVRVSQDNSVTPVKVRVEVSPGAPALIGAVDIGFEGPVTAAGPEAARRLERIRKGWRLPAGSRFRQADWDQAKNELVRQLSQESYAAARITTSAAVVDPVDRRVAVTLRLDSGPAYRFGALQVEGLRRYPRAMVEKLNPIVPGTPFQREALAELQTRLLEAGWFDSALVTADPETAGPDSSLPVRVILGELPRFKVSFGLGYSSSTGNRAQFGFQDLLVNRRGWRLIGNVKLETRRQSASADILLPMKRAGEHDRFGALFDRSSLQGDVTRKVGAGAWRTWKKGDYETSLALQYQIEQEAIDGSLTRNNRALSLNYSRTARKTDDALFPTRGYMLNAQLGGAARALLSDRNFVRAYLKGLVYHPLPAGTLILRAETGITLATSRIGIPSEFLFRAGGDQSVRGYAYQSLGIREGNAVVGGRFLALASVEYVHRVTRDWGAALFYDAGDAADSRRTFRIHKGYGVGARWRSPVGPLSLDVAYGEQTRETRLHISVGLVF